MRLFFVSIITLLAMAFSSANAQSDRSFESSTIGDLALIYQGGAHRIDWTEDEIMPYVTHRFTDGSEKWLFDGFLFLEFKDGKGRQFSPGYDKQNATRDDWQWYINRLFEPGKSLHALDQAISSAKKRIGNPEFRHKVVLTIMVPIPGQTDWGVVDGDSLDFSGRADQLKAIEWFVGQLTDRFAQAKFKNLDLDGMYWIDEDMKATEDLTASVSPMLHERGLRFYWIPYFKSYGHERWKELGFDMAYHQPNHFFHTNIPDSRLDEAIDIAQANGMAMEFECDERAKESYPGATPERMAAYMDAFERRGVFNMNFPIAYYTGNHLLLDMTQEPSEADRKLIDRFARLVSSRRAAR